METILEKINKMVCTRLQEHQSKMGYNESINIEHFATDCAIEQDRIARQEEREKCIRIAQNALCCRCIGKNKVDKCTISEGCKKRGQLWYIRQAMEGGNNGND